jgi:cobalt/nickel transport system permease protein
MLPVHAVIGLGEALLTVAALAVFAREPETESADAWRAPAATAGVIALLFSPWASALPDGLERVAAGGGFLPGVEAFWRGPLPEYAIPGLPGAALATGLAGLLGATLVFAGGLLLARALAARAEAAIARKGIS